MISDLKNLVTFVEVAKKLSFAEVARTLNVPPSTVTTRIKSLETQLGVRLLVRSTRHVALSREGQDFADHCRRALAEIEHGQEKIANIEEPCGLVRISIPIAFPKAQFAALIAKFRQEFPNVSIEVIFEDRLTNFIDDHVDLALRGGAPRGDDLYARHLAKTPVVCIAPPAHNDKPKTALPLLTPLNPAQAGSKKIEGVGTSSLEFSLHLVIEGQASAYLPYPVCASALEEKQVVEIPGPLGPQAPLNLFLIYHDKRYQPKRVSVFKEFLIRSLSNTG